MAEKELDKDVGCAGGGAREAAKASGPSEAKRGWVLRVLIDPLVRDGIWFRRAANQKSTDEKAAYARQKRLREAMAAMRVDKVLLDDAILIERLDQWLVEKHRGKRLMPQFEGSIRRALRHAAQEGWISGYSG